MQSGCSIMRLPELPCEHPAEARHPHTLKSEHRLRPNQCACHGKGSTWLQIVSESFVKVSNLRQVWSAGHGLSAKDIDFSYTVTGK